MTIVLDTAIVILALASAATAYRMFAGPTDADRAVAADLLLFGIVGLLAVFGVRSAAAATFDIVLTAALVGFLSALALASALARGAR